MMLSRQCRRLSTTPAVAAAAAPKVVKRGSTLGQRLTAFTVGVVVTGGAGYYQLRQDIEASTQELRDAIAALKLDVMESQESLTKRTSKLERQTLAIQNA